MTSVNEFSQALGIEFDADSEWWWTAFLDGRFQLPSCDVNGHLYFPPSPYCPECGTRGFNAVDADRNGSVYSWVTVHVAMDPAYEPDVPYTIVTVDLDAGPRMIGRLVGTDVRPGLRVHVGPARSGARFAIEFLPNSAE